MNKSMADIFNLICSAEYTKIGDEVDFCLIRDDQEKAIFVLFQESREVKDWKVNFNFPAKIYKHQENNFKVAQGWGEAYKSANDFIMEQLFKLLDDYSYEVWICGWSYGGALAQLCAEDFHYRYGEYANVVTFGSPKLLFSKKTVEYFKSCCSSVKNFQHVNDCIPLLPPFPGYHNTNPVKIGSNFSISKLFNPNIYHCIYDDKSIY